MIGYVCIGSSDFDRSVEYYEKLLAPLGAKRLLEIPNFTLIGKSMEEPSIAVVRPFDGNPPSAGNGMMVALQVHAKEDVDALYARALELGGSDEGPPGDREGFFYAAYFRDPDGNKLNVFVLPS